MMHAELTWEDPEQIRAQHQRAPEDPPRLLVIWEASEMAEVQMMIDRAFGTLEPRDWPKWVKPLEKVVREISEKTAYFF
jgi:hypothetical protein